MSLVKKILQYAVPLLLAGALLFYAYKDFDFQQLAHDLRQVNLALLLLAMVPLTASHLIRAARWNQLLGPLGFKPRLGATFNAVMSGYFGNLILPRMGEVVRCGILQRNSRVPVSASLGTVIAERGIDVVLLLLITLLAFVFEFQAVSGLFGQLLEGRSSGGDGSGSGATVLLILLGVGLLGALLVYLLRNTLMKIKVVAAIFDFLGKLLQGVLSIFRLKNPGAFIAGSFAIWGLYWLTGWITLMAMPDTAHLSGMAAFLILVMGSYGMVAPVQGGIGAYHFMVKITLVTIYALSEQASMTAALVLHTSQTLHVILLGGSCYLVSVLGKPAAEPMEPTAASADGEGPAGRS